MRCRGHGARFIYNRVGQKRAPRRDARVEYYARVLRRPHAARKTCLRKRDRKKRSSVVKSGERERERDEEVKVKNRELFCDDYHEERKIKPFSLSLSL